MALFLPVFGMMKVILCDLLSIILMEIISRTARDVHPPGYYFFAKIWISIFGNSAFAIRSMSVIFSVGIIYLIYRIVENLFGKREASWAAMLIVLSPFMIRFAQEARMYGVVAFFTTLGTYYFIKFVKENDKRILFCYVLSILAAVFTQYYAFFVIIVHWLILIMATPGCISLKWKDSIQKSWGFLIFIGG